MRRAVISLLLAACSGIGCVSVPSWYPKPDVPPAAEKPVRPRLPVSADQITESNAREIAGALVDELDRDGH